MVVTSTSLRKQLPALGLVLLLVLIAGPATTAAVKVRRVKAGKHYKTHDPVHIVVNKVGYVFVFSKKDRKEASTPPRPQPPL